MMRFDYLVSELISNGWTLLGDEETGINFVNIGTEVEVIIDRDEGVTFLSIGNRLRKKDIKDLKKVAFSEKGATFIFSDGEEWDFEVREEDFDYYYQTIEEEEKKNLKESKKKSLKKIG